MFPGRPGSIGVRCRYQGVKTTTFRPEILRRRTFSGGDLDQVSTPNHEILLLEISFKNKIFTLKYLEIFGIILIIFISYLWRSVCVLGCVSLECLWIYKMNKDISCWWLQWLVFVSEFVVIHEAPSPSTRKNDTWRWNPLPSCWETWEFHAYLRWQLKTQSIKNSFDTELIGVVVVVVVVAVAVAVATYLLVNGRSD